MKQHNSVNHSTLYVYLEYKQKRSVPASQKLLTNTYSTLW